MEDPFIQDQLQPFLLDALYTENIERLIVGLHDTPQETLGDWAQTFQTVPLPVIANFSELLENKTRNIFHTLQRTFSRRDFLKRAGGLTLMTLLAQWFLYQEDEFFNDPNDLVLTDRELNIFTPAGNSLAIGVGSLPINEIREALEEGKTIGFVKPLVDLLNNDYYEKVHQPNEHNFAHFHAIENLLKAGVTSEDFLGILQIPQNQEIIQSLGKRIFTIVIGPDDIFRALEIIRAHVDSGNPEENLSNALLNFGMHLHQILALFKKLSSQSKILIPTLPNLLQSPAVANALRHKPELAGFLENYMETFNDIIKFMAKIHGASCFRLDKTKIKVTQFSADNLHPNQSGYNEIAYEAKQVCRIEPRRM